MYRSRDIEMLRSQVTAAALESTIAFLGSIKEGRKSILFVSQTIGRVGTGPMDTFTWLDGAIRLANANNTTIYAFDPRGLDMNIAPSDVLQQPRRDRPAASSSRTTQPAHGAARGRQELERVLPARLRLGEEPRRRQVPQDFGQGEAAGRRSAVAHRLLRAVARRRWTRRERRRPRPTRRRPRSRRRWRSSSTRRTSPCAGDLWAGAAPGPDGTPRVTVAWTPRDGLGGAAWRSAPAAADGTVYFDGPLRGGPGRVRRGARHDEYPPARLIETDGSLADRAGLDARGARLRRRAAVDHHAGRVPRPHAARTARDPGRRRIRAVRGPPVRAHRSHRRALRRVRPGAADATVTVDAAQPPRREAGDDAAEDDRGAATRSICRSARSPAASTSSRSSPHAAPTRRRRSSVVPRSELRSSALLQH